MNPSFSSDWSREEKEEYATKRMNEMKLKNEKFKQRHAEVEKDRLEAEKKCSAVTSGAKILPNSPDSIEEKPAFHHEPRKQREWDIGKSTNDGDWYPPAQQDYQASQDYQDSRTWHNESDRYPPAQQDYHRSQDYHHSRPPRRGGFYDKRRERQDGPWRSRGAVPASHRGGPRYRGSNQSRSTTFQSGNSNYSRESNKNSFKASNESSFKTSTNWNDSKRNAYYSGNPFPKLTVKSDTDKMWHDDGLNEVQNKQSRVEKWVKSINKVEDWSEGDEKPCKNFKSVSTGRDSGNYQDKEKAWNNEGHVESSTKRHFTQNKAKYDKQYEHSFTKNVSTYGDKMPPTSDAFVGKKTSYVYKRDNKSKYNHGVSSYDKIEVSNFKNDPKIRKQSHHTKDSGADIWDYEDVEDSSNKLSDLKTKFNMSKHIQPDKNRDSKSVVWDYKETDHSASKTRSEVRKKEYYKKKDAESDVWNDCDQTNNWGNKFQTRSSSKTKEQDRTGSDIRKKDTESDIWNDCDQSDNWGSKLDSNNGSKTKEQDHGKCGNGNWDYYHGDDWNNKDIDSEIESKVNTEDYHKNTDSECIGWDNEKKDNVKDESQIIDNAHCDISNDYSNNLTDKEIFTSEKNNHDEDEGEKNIYYNTKEMNISTKRLNNLEVDSENSTYENKTNDSNQNITVKLEFKGGSFNCNKSSNSEFVISNCETVDNELDKSKAKFDCDENKYDCVYKSKDSDSVENILEISEYSDDILNDSKNEPEVQDDCHTDSNELEFGNLNYENIDNMNEGKDLKSELKKMGQLPCLSINENSPSENTLPYESQTEISVESYTASHQSVTHESDEMSNQNNSCVETNKGFLKDESNLSCVSEEAFTLNSDNSVIITPSKLNEREELLQQSTCNVENKNIPSLSENQDTTMSSFSEISAENLTCDIINKSSLVLSQESVVEDDPSSHSDVKVTESTKSLSELETDIGALHLPDNRLPVDTDKSNAKILNNI